MPTSRHPIQDVANEESDSVVLRDNRAPSARFDKQGASDLANQVKMAYDKPTDVMHVDLGFPSETDRVEVLDVGDCLGFPGQIVARVDLENRIVYGLTIQRFSAFKRTLLWRYRMVSIQRALLFLLTSLGVGLWIDRGSRPALSV
jgi:hypothetical protein